MIKPVKIIENLPKPMNLGKSHGKKYRPIKQITPSGLPYIDTSVSFVTVAFNKVAKFARNLRNSFGSLF